jgi:predicted nucleic acid-binding protein
LDISRAEEALADYLDLDLPLSRHGHTTLLSRILELGEILSACDESYVTLAEKLDAQLLTTDRRFAKATRAEARLGLFLAGGGQAALGMPEAC